MGKIELTNTKVTATNWWDKIEIPIVNRTYRTPSNGVLVPFYLTGISLSTLVFNSEIPGRGECLERIFARKPCPSMPFYTGELTNRNGEITPLFLLPNITVALIGSFPELVDKFPITYTLAETSVRKALSELRNRCSDYPANTEIYALGRYWRDETHPHPEPIQQRVEYEGNIILNNLSFETARLYCLGSGGSDLAPYNEPMTSPLFKQ